MIFLDFNPHSISNASYIFAFRSNSMILLANYGTMFILDFNMASTFIYGHQEGKLYK